jgi:hypothetical protein
MCVVGMSLDRLSEAYLAEVAEFQGRKLRLASQDANSGRCAAASHERSWGADKRL